MNQLLSKADLPEGSIAKVVDRDGVVLARYPNPQDWVGKSLANDFITKTILQTGDDGTVEGVGADGIRRLYAFAPLQAGDENSAFIAVGIPSQQAFARAEASWRQDFLLFLSVALFAFLITWSGGLVLGKKTELLTIAIHRLAQDDLTVQSGVQSWISEINDLAASFDQMANQISRQRIELTFAEARYRSLVEQLPAVTFLVSLANGVEVLYLSPQAKDLFGSSQKGKEKDYWQDHIYPDDLPIVQRKGHPMQVGERTDLEYRLVLPDGQIRWVSDITTVIADENGQPTLLQGMLTDITDRKNIHEQLNRKIKEMACLQAITSACMQAKLPNELLQAATKSVSEYLMVDNFGVMLLDPVSGLLRMHSAYHLPDGDSASIHIPLGEGITGSTALDGIPRRLGDITTAPDYIRIGSKIHSELCVPIKSGEQIYGVLNLESTRVNAYSEYDENLMLAIADQIALGLDRLRFEEELEAIATIDELSSLNNRRGFLKLARKELLHALRGNNPLAMLVFDIDRFKQINDDYGHPIGDKAIQEVSNRCEQILRESDIIGRLGGDEFAILLSNTDLSGAQKVAERIRQAIAQGVLTPKGLIEITLSIGIAQIIDLKDCTIDDLFSLADEALYEAKRNGRDQVATRTAASQKDLP
jgi:diguanylate cyclase (GGDEF)-like protein/PAS domain S-box-containing protein